MARIRSIKPEFWTDGKIRRLSDSTALFFIGLWTFADDFGYFHLDGLELAAKLSRWRSQSTVGMLSALSRAGLIKVSRESGVGLIEGWEHQKIKDRRISKWAESTIHWDAPEVAAPGSAKIRPGVDRRGVDRSGEDLLAGGSSTTAAVPSKTRRPKPTIQPASSAAWDAYAIAYESRYGAAPTRNLKVNGQLAQFIQRVPADEAPEIARFYVSHNASRYVGAMHPIGLMLMDAEKLRTEWATGARMTHSKANQVDRMQSTFDAFDAAFEKINGVES